jgi:hypothetical protein
VPDDNSLNSKLLETNSDLFSPRSLDFSDSNMTDTDSKKYPYSNARIVAADD